MMSKHVVRWAAIALGLAAVAGCDGGHRGQAQTDCSLATLKGGYIFAYDGFNVGGPSAADRLPFAAAGHETYNGDGTVSGFSTTNTNGVVTAAAYAGTYTLESDCMGTTTLTDENDVTTPYIPLHAIFLDYPRTYDRRDIGVGASDWDKTYPVTATALEEQWDAAERATADCARLVIIGSALRGEDAGLIGLVQRAASCADDIAVVNPSEPAHDRARAVCGKSVQWFRSIDDFTAHLAAP